MSYTGLGGLVLGTGLVAAFACALLHRIVHHDRFRRYHDVGYAVFLQLGVIFAVLLAFVFNGVWSDYNTASQAIDSECASLHGIAILSDRLPSPARKAILDAAKSFPSPASGCTCAVRSITSGLDSDLRSFDGGAPRESGLQRRAVCCERLVPLWLESIRLDTVLPPLPPPMRVERRVAKLLRQVGTRSPDPNCRYSAPKRLIISIDHFNGEPTTTGPTADRAEGPFQIYWRSRSFCTRSWRRACSSEMLFSLLVEVRR